MPSQKPSDQPQPSSVPGYFSTLWQAPVIGLSMRFTLILILFYLIMLAMFYWRLPPEIPFTYSQPWGNEQLVPSLFLFIVLAMELLILAINFLLASFLFFRHRLLSQMLMWAGSLVVLLIDITTLRVFLLVT